MYRTGEGLVRKVPKNQRGIKENRNEYRIYKDCPEPFKSALCPVISLSEDDILEMREAIPLATLYQNGSIEFDELERLIREKSEVTNYLSTHYAVDSKELEFGANWGLIREQVVCIDYGCLVGDHDG